MKIEIKDNEYNFMDVLTFNAYMFIQDDFPEASGIVDEKWWLKKTDFGMYFLNSVYLSESGNDLNIPEDLWPLFHPVFKSFFPSTDEYHIILHNLRFLHKQVSSVIENKYFLKYIMMKEFGNLTIKDLCDMLVKDALMLYYYIINNKLVEMYGLDLLIEQEKEKAGEDMFR